MDFLFRILILFYTLKKTLFQKLKALFQKFNFIFKKKKNLQYTSHKYITFIIILNNE